MGSLARAAGLAGLLLWAGGAWAAPAGGAYAGRPLVDVLAELGDGGLTLVYTSELVRADMTVAREPTATDPRQLLEEVLAPHGLAVREAPGGVLVVVVAPGGPRPPGATVRGEVRARGGRSGVAGAEVRVVGGQASATADADGRFELPALPPGRYTLEASAQGFLEQRLSDFEVGAGPVRRVVFRLPPRPFLEEEIVVRPSRQTLLLERPDSSFSLGRDEIDALPHLGDDLFRTSSLFPGTAANDVTARFSVHGGRRDEVRILLDGQELYEAFHLTDYDRALSIVPARSLAGASLSTGAYPVAHGDRMSGVLDLRTAEPPAGSRTVLALSVLDALASSAGTLAGGRAGWLLTGRRGSLDLAGNVVGDDEPVFWDLLGKVEGTTRLGAFTLHGLVAADELEVDRREEEFFEHLDNDYRSRYAWLDHRVGRRRLVVATSASWADVVRDRSGVTSEEEGRFALRDRRDLEVEGLRQRWSLQHGPRHLLEAGWEARRYDAFFDYAKDLDLDLVLVAPFSAPRATAHSFLGTVRGDHLGVWVSERLPVGERGTAELGLRWDEHDATGDEELSPRANLAWRLGERTVLRAAWGRFVQSQRPYELQVEDGESELAPAERSEHRVVGWETLLAPARGGLEAVRVELFGRDVANPRPRFENLFEHLNYFPEIEPDRVRLAPERTAAEGVELLLRGRGGDAVAWWLAWSWSRVEDRLGGDEVRRSLDQPHAATLDVDFRLPRRWRLNLAWRYHTGWPTTPVEVIRVGQPGEPGEPEDPGDPGEPEDPPEEPGLVVVAGPLNARRLPDYHRLDLRASRSWERPSGRWSLFFDVQNVYDRRNLAGFDLALDEEEGTLELEEENWPGLFPSLGVSWEF